MENKRKMKLGVADRVILGTGYGLLGIFCILILIPLAYVVAASFMDPNVLNNQGISFDLKDWTIDAYRRVLENKMIWRGFINSLFSSVYSDFRFYCTAGGISHVQKGTGRKTIF